MTLPVVLFEICPRGIILRSGGGGRKALVDRSDDPVGQSVFDLYADAPQVLAGLRRALSGEAFTARVEVPRGPAPPILFETAYTPFFSADGEVERVAGVALDVTDREAATREAVRAAERLRRLSARLQTERERERTRVARTVHDAVGQALTALRFDARWLRRHLTSDSCPDPDGVRARLDDIDAVVEGAIEAVQDLAADLRPPLLDSLGLSAALAATVSRFTERTGIAAHLSRMLTPDEEESVGQVRATAAFRIVQEALTNASRHAGASSVAIRLRLEAPTADALGELPARWPSTAATAGARALVVDITDDGCGIAPEAVHAGTPGLTGMAERAAEWGGTLYIGSADGAGAVVRATLPLGAERCGVLS